MRGTKAKALRRAMYGNYAYPGEAIVNMTGQGFAKRCASELRRTYRRAKRQRTR